MLAVSLKPFVVCQKAFVVCQKPFVVCQKPFVVCQKPFVVRPSNHERLHAPRLRISRPSHST
ncbi:hypothetical protein Thivi_4330 [Thiocystis violascens DSM 198]|uniref:Uncharacterized protein n=1 Tax=Thiocystis violascens (strain ATCC 17096 / DSM 198 / 6111) TaxID=765911 RepID=I3YGM2_THIV6|nr:hypothetical protein Thivi_4330 [Thiocystis violascens DSM 198]